VFFPGDEDRPRQIAYMPRRGQAEARQVLGILGGRDALRGWEVTALDGLTETEVAHRLRSTLIFLSFAYQEGFGLPAAEAMACGCYVIGFHGFSGREFFRSEFSSPVAPGDVLDFARAVERSLAREALEPGWCARRGAAASRFIAAEYAPERERHDVVDTYRSLLLARNTASPAGDIDPREKLEIF
jgi:glycosyltransferase involved in cell wall biosynthesis